MTVYARPGTEGSLMSFQSRYENYIGGEWVAPTAGRYFENASPVTGQPFCEIPRSDEADIEKALDAAHAAAPAWGKTTAASTRSPTASRRTSNPSLSPNHGTTASRCVRRSTRISRWR
jgi:hypothetical protein